MINSNFSCGYYINREKLYKLLKYKYKINSNFDPCSYPGIQCEFYHDALLSLQHGIQPTTESAKASVESASVSSTTKESISNAKASIPVSKISFMVFRTGSVLIVGKCSEDILYEIYAFLCRLFETEFDEIKGLTINPVGTKKEKEKVRKLRKKIILV